MAWIARALHYLNGREQVAATTDYLMQAMPKDTIDTNLTIPAGRQYAINGTLTINTGIVLTVADTGRLVIS